MRNFQDIFQDFPGGVGTLYAECRLQNTGCINKNRFMLVWLCI